MKTNNRLLAITIRLPDSTLSQLTDVSEIVRKERNLIEHLPRQALVQEAIEDFIKKHIPQSK